MMSTTTQQDMMKALGNETKIEPYRYRKPTSVHAIASETLSPLTFAHGCVVLAFFSRGNVSLALVKVRGRNLLF
jgi:hypothetical protein